MKKINDINDTPELNETYLSSLMETVSLMRKRGVPLDEGMVGNFVKGKLLGALGIPTKESYAEWKKSFSAKATQAVQIIDEDIRALQSAITVNPQNEQVFNNYIASLEKSKQDITNAINAVVTMSPDPEEYSQDVTQVDNLPPPSEEEINEINGGQGGQGQEGQEGQDQNGQDQNGQEQNGQGGDHGQGEGDQGQEDQEDTGDGSTEQNQGGDSSGENGGEEENPPEGNPPEENPPENGGDESSSEGEEEEEMNENIHLVARRIREMYGL